MSPVRVLIGEDDSVLRDLCLRKFDPSTFQIVTANNGAEAIQKIQEQAPDVVLLDLNMPGVDGFAVLEKFPRASRTFPIIILTNYDDQANREKGLSMGADAYIVKRSINVKGVVEVVEKMINAHSSSLSSPQ